MECLPSGYGKQCYLVPEIFTSGSIQDVTHLFPQVYIVHYISDILLAQKDEGILLETNGQLQQSLTHAVLILAPEKVQGTHLSSI